MMTRTTLFSLLAVYLLASYNLCAADGSWHVPEAEYRIQLSVNARVTPSLLVRLPLEFGHWKGISCFSSAGKVVSRPVHVDGRMVAIELTPKSGLDQTLYVYPSDAPSKRPPRMAELLPVACYYTGEKLVARPANGIFMRQCMLSRAALPFYRCLPQIPVRTYGIHLFYKYQTSTENLRAASMKIRARLRANLVIEKPTTIQFGLNNPNSGPWYLFIGGKPVFSWGNCTTGADKIPVSKELTLNPGIHSLDLFAFPGYGEHFPELRMRTDKSSPFQNIPYTMLFSALSNTRYRIDHKNAQAICNFTLTPERHLYYRESKTYDLRHQLVDLTPGRKVTYSYDGETLNFRLGYADMNLSTSESILTAALGDKAPIKRLRFPIAGDSFACSERIIRLRVTDLPMFETVEKPLSIRYGATVDNGIDPLPSRTNLELTTHFASGKEPVKTVTVVPIFPNQRIVTLPRPDADVARLDLRLLVGHVPASNVVPIHLVSPQKKLTFPDNGGRFLHYDDGLAILRRQAGALKPDAVRWNGSVGSITLVDGFIANAKHPYDNGAFDDFSWGSTSVAHVPIATDRDNHFLIEKFRALDIVASGSADMVLFAPPLKEITELDLRDLREHALYLIRVVRASGKQIGFVTPPAVKELASEKLRSYVLILKELGRTFQFPVVDLYSASSGRDEVNAYWDWYEAEATPLRTAVPNAAGRKWALNEIKKVLEKKKWK